MLAVFEAIVRCGCKAARAYPQPRKTDHETLQADLLKRGWSQTDLQLFSDARALSHAAPDKVCQLVRDWFRSAWSRRIPTCSCGCWRIPEADCRRLSALLFAGRKRERVSADTRRTRAMQPHSSPRQASSRNADTGRTTAFRAPPKSSPSLHLTHDFPRQRWRRQFYASIAGATALGSLYGGRPARVSGGPVWRVRLPADRRVCGRLLPPR